jgi:Protein kinase domain
MNETLKCPNRPRLQELLAGSLPAREQTDLVAHLDTCVLCQETLETLAAGERPFPHLTPTPECDKPAVGPLLHRAIKVLESRADRFNDSNADDVSLACLDPPRDPAHLGALGRYDVFAVIRRGGMGWVLKALDANLNRIVAIKVIAPHLISSSAARQRFAREALAAGTIHDRHVVAIHSVEETGQGVPYLVMEYIEGMSLQDHLDAGRLQLPEIMAIATQVTRGLAAAHERGVIHRDIKPGNIMLEAGTGRALLTDFGLARAVDDVSLTQSGVAAGTPQYMAPEQSRAESVDQRSDLFSLGSVLYAMCTGHPPFRATGNLAVLNQICEATPRPIREINAVIPEWLVQVIAKLHAKRPNDRFASAADVATALERQVRQASPRRRFPKWAAAILLALSGLAISEAAGVTNLAGVVIRVFTPDGILVVDVNDPAIKVTIENDGKEVVVTGPGIQEIRLRTGDHKIQATRDGKPMPLQENVVTITCDKKQVLRISREDIAAIGAQQRLDQAVSLYERGARLRTDKPVDSERILRQSIDTFERLAAESPKDNRYQKHLEQCRWHLGSTINLQSARLIHNPKRTDADIKRALELSQEATKLIPNDGGIWLNLGWAEYRGGDWEASLVSANKAVDLRKGGEADDRFLCAMANWKVGDKDKAREHYNRGIEWMDKNRPTEGRLRGQQAEVEQLLGISKPGQ